MEMTCAAVQSATMVIFVEVEKVVGKETYS